MAHILPVVRCCVVLCCAVPSCTNLVLRKKQHHTSTQHTHQQEAEAIAFNRDAKAGPVFVPAKDDYQETFKLGAKDSKERSKYDTGEGAGREGGTAWDTRCTCVVCAHAREEAVGGSACVCQAQSDLCDLRLPFCFLPADSAFFWADPANTSAITGELLT